MAGEFEVAYLVEEYRPPVGQLEASRPVGVGIGEGAFFVPEEFALEEALRQTAEVYFDERLLRPLAVLVYRFGYQFLARPAFSRNEDGGRRRGDARDGLEDSGQLRTLPDDFPEARTVQHWLLVGLLGQVEGVADGFQEHQVVPRFRDEVEGSGLHPLHG